MSLAIDGLYASADCNRDGSYSEAEAVSFLSRTYNLTTQEATTLARKFSGEDNTFTADEFNTLKTKISGLGDFNKKDGANAQDVRDYARSLLPQPSWSKDSSTSSSPNDDEFRAAVVTLNISDAHKFMDWVEWYDNNDAADADNGRFGDHGVDRLANATVDDPLWAEFEKYVGHSISAENRQQFIDAAKTVLLPEHQSSYDGMKDDNVNGNSVFSNDAMSNFLGYSPPKRSDHHKGK